MKTEKRLSRRCKGGETKKSFGKKPSMGQSDLPTLLVESYGVDLKEMVTRKHPFAEVMEAMKNFVAGKDGKTPVRVNSIQSFEGV